MHWSSHTTLLVYHLTFLSSLVPSPSGNDQTHTGIIIPSFKTFKLPLSIFPYLLPTFGFSYSLALTSQRNRRIYLNTSLLSWDCLIVSRVSPLLLYRCCCCAAAAHDGSTVPSKTPNVFLTGLMSTFATNYIPSGGLIVLLTQSSIPISMYISKVSLLLWPDHSSHDWHTLAFVVLSPDLSQCALHAFTVFRSYYRHGRHFDCFDAQFYGRCRWW